MQTALVVVISYLLGSIPAGDIAARLRGVDIRTVGSGNPGFTNVLRTLGAWVAAPVLVVDIAKGAVAVLFVAGVLGSGSPLGPTGIRLAAGIAAIAGHNWPVFSRFKGGRGVATACGMFAAMSPLGTLAAVVLWLAMLHMFIESNFVDMISHNPFGTTLGWMALSLTISPRWRSGIPT